MPLQSASARYGAHEGDRTLLQPVDSRWHSPECDVRKLVGAQGLEP